jgi:hypothetical protein
LLAFHLPILYSGMTAKGVRLAKKPTVAKKEVTAKQAKPSRRSNRITRKNAEFNEQDLEKYIKERRERTFVNRTVQQVAGAVEDDDGEETNHPSWECCCGIENPHEEPVCVKCGKHPRNSVTLGWGGTLLAVEPSTWTCGICTLKNSLDKINCAACYGP